MDVDSWKLTRSLSKIQGSPKKGCPVTFVFRNRNSAFERGF